MNPKNNLAENLATARLDYRLGANDNMFAHFKWDHGVQPTHVDPISTISTRIATSRTMKASWRRRTPSRPTW